MIKMGVMTLLGSFLLLGTIEATPLEANTIYPVKGVTGGPERIAECVPGELIVKFHPQWGSRLQEIRGADARSYVTENDPIFSDIAKLNRKLHLKGLRRLVTKHEIIWDKTTEESFLTALYQFPSRGARSPAGHTAKLPDLEHLYVLRFPADVDVWEAARLYAALPGIVYAEPNMLFHTQLAPDDPFYHSWGSWGQRYAVLWGLQNIEAEAAWDRTAGSDEIVIAVTDTGLDLDHEDITANVWSTPDEIPSNGIDDDGNGYVDDVVGWDFVNGDNDPTDDVGHGSHVAGTIAAVGDNGLGVVGVAWNCRVMPVKGLGAEGGTTEWLVNALIYAADNGADVINCSWGGYNSGPAGRALHEAIQHAYNLGCVIVAAAGNSTDSVMEYAPSAFDEVITVSATNQRDQWCDFSNWGFKIDLSAPGGDSGFIRDDGTIDFSKANILSLQADYIDIYEEMNYPGYRRGECILGEHYYRLLGTSMAAPHVSGLAAFILSLHPEFTVEEVRRVLWAGADDVEEEGWDIFTGHGRINARRSLSLQDPSALPLVEISNPTHEETVTSRTVTVTGTANASGFQHYTLEWGLGELPYDWKEIYRSSTPVTNGVLCEWDPTGSIQGYGILKLTVYSSDTKPFSVFRHCRIANHLLEGWPQRVINV